MDLKPGQKCNRCTRVLENCYSIVYDKDCVIREVICDMCNDVEYMDDYKKDGILSTKVMMNASMAKFYLQGDGSLERLRKEVQEFYLQNCKYLLKASKEVDEVSELVSKFEDKHWLPYLKKYWNKSTQRGHEAKIDDVQVMMWGSAGRVLITAKKDHYDVTMIFSDYVPDKKDVQRYESDMKKYGHAMPINTSGGIQGIGGTRDIAVSLMETLLKAEKIEFHPEKDVRMLGL